VHKRGNNSSIQIFMLLNGLAKYQTIYTANKKILGDYCFDSFSKRVERRCLMMMMWIIGFAGYCLR
jgi:hypothetical protein